MSVGILLILLAALGWLCVVQQAEIASLTKALRYAEARQRALAHHPATREEATDGY